MLSASELEQFAEQGFVHLRCRLPVPSRGRVP